ncbi:mechanosensitive ion channel [Lachnospiraceae bacterium NSJ-143]|nr:mechanosensitive ion channel [Lachnospiraceae bacterium NSJ-143]
MNILNEGLKEAFGFKLGTFTLENLVSAVITFFICYIAIKVIMKFIKPLITKLPIDATLHKFSLSVIKVLLYFLAVIIVAQSFGINATSLIALFSVAGLAVSLAIQGSLSNIASGIVMLLTKPFLAGDYIEAGGIGGTVKEIGFIHTKIITVDNKVIYIPNSEISSGKITNYSAEALRRVDLNFEASYESETETVKRAILNAVNDCGIFLNEPEVFVSVSQYKDSSIQYVVRAWIKNSDYWTGYYMLIENVKKEFDANDIVMTYNHLNVHMIKD